MRFLTLLPLLSGLLCLGLAALVLAKNRTHPINRAFALGMVAFAVMEGGNVDSRDMSVAQRPWPETDPSMRTCALCQWRLYNR